MAKVHLRANRPVEGKAFVARATCASQLIGGKLKFNSRGTYRFMASEIVSRPEFAKVPAKDRCAHCCDTGLALRNALRAKTGLAPLSNLFEDLPA